MAKTKATTIIIVAAVLLLIYYLVQNPGTLPNLPTPGQGAIPYS